MKHFVLGTVCIILGEFSTQLTLVKDARNLYLYHIFNSNKITFQLKITTDNGKPKGKPNLYNRYNVIILSQFSYFQSSVCISHL